MAETVSASVIIKEIVSNHALIRYFERVIGVTGLDITRPSVSFATIHQAGYDVEATRDQIRALVAPAIALRSSGFTCTGITFKIANGMLSTVFVGVDRNRTRSNKRAGQRIAYREARSEQGRRPRSDRRYREDTAWR